MQKRVLIGFELIKKLVDAGIVPPESTHVIIDIKATEFVTVHYTAAATEDLLEVVAPLAQGAQLKDSPAAPG